MGLTPEQKALRMTGVSSSDVPAICQLYPSTWKSSRGPDDVLREKLGEDGFEGNARTDRGDLMEPFIASVWAEEHGRTVSRNPNTSRHPSIEWALATPDYYVAGPDNTTTELLEIKLVGPYALKSWEKGPPLYVQAQCQWQLGCIGVARANIAAWVEGDRDVAGPRSFVLEAKPAEFALLVKKCGEFWGRVLAARLERRAANG